MTLDEARQIARVIGTADSGCSSCVHNLVDKLNNRQLGWTFVYARKPLFVRNEYDDEYRSETRYVKVEEPTP